MKLAVIIMSAGLVTLGAIAGVASGSHTHSSRTPSVATLVSQRLASLGSSVTSPRGPFRTRPTKLTLNDGYHAGNSNLWIDHLKWVDWGKPVSYASGIVHARDWQGSGFVVTAGGIVLDQLRGCGTRYYYTAAAMFAPAGFPANTERTATGETGQALTPC